MIKTKSPKSEISYLVKILMFLTKKCQKKKMKIRILQKYYQFTICQSLIGNFRVKIKSEKLSKTKMVETNKKKKNLYYSSNTKSVKLDVYFFFFEQ